MFLIKSELLVYLNARIVTSPKHGVIGGSWIMYMTSYLRQRLDRNIHKFMFKNGLVDLLILREKFPVNYDYEELANITKQLTRNLNRVIDKSTYPIESARRSNIRHRPIGIGYKDLRTYS